MASPEEGEDLFNEDSSSRDRYSSKSSRSYRSRDKDSYGDSAQSDIDYHKQQRFVQTSSSLPDDRKKHKEHRHGDRPSSRKQEEDSRHHRTLERKSRSFRDSDRNNEYQQRDNNRGEFKRSRSRSPKHSSSRSSAAHSDKRPHPQLTSHYSEPAPRGAWSHHKHHTHHHHSSRHTRDRHSHRSTHANSDDDTKRYNSSRGGERLRLADNLVRDFESSGSSSSSTNSDSEGEVKETTPTSSNNEKGGKKEKEEETKVTWKTLLLNEEEEEEEETKKMVEFNDTSNENISSDDSLNNDITMETEEVKVEVNPPTPPEIINDEAEKLPESPLLSPPPTEEVLYLPALMGCRSVECYEWLNRIEEGTYGVVFRAKDTRTDEIVALKKLKMEKEREGFPITSLREISTLLKANHENIVNVREIVVGSNMDKIFIVMDYVEHDLKSLMETMKQPFLEGEIKTLLIQLLRAVHHLHDNWMIHRDLKTSNLLLSHKGILKVADFGLAREYGSPLQKYTPVVVTLWYRAPELLLGAKEYSVAIDMWSVGCIFAELLQHKPLFMGKSEIDQLNQIFKELGTPNDTIWPGFSQLPIAKKVQFTHQPLNNLRKRFPMITKNGFGLLNKFFAYDPKRRITAEEALKQDYFEESPLPVDPGMFPTWPAKSEMIKKTARPKSPTAPEGGAFFHEQKEEQDSTSEKFQLPQGEAGKAGPGFTLKF